MTLSVLSSASSVSGNTSRWALAGFVLSVISAGTAAAAGLGTRWDAWQFGTGFIILRIAVVGALVSFAVSCAGAVMARPESRRPGLTLAVIGIVLSFFTAAGPLSAYAAARQLPVIHDITTDTDDPPQFVEILPLREHALNPPVYGGPEVAAQQRAAYPDVKPLDLLIPPDQALAKARAVARSLRWRVISVNRDAGRIEATDQTLWFGFIDDIVIRVRPEGTGSRIDIRSESRVGRSDIGTNAARIMKFLKKMEGTAKTVSRPDAERATPVL